MKYLIVLFLLGCSHDVDSLKNPSMPDSDSGVLLDAIGPLPDVWVELDSSELDSSSSMNDAGPVIERDAGQIDAGPPVSTIDACFRLRTVWYAYMLDTTPRCEHVCPWVDRPGPCDAAAVDLCETAITAAAEVHDCAEYENRLAICDEAACD